MNCDWGSSLVLQENTSNPNEVLKSKMKAVPVIVDLKKQLLSGFNVEYISLILICNTLSIIVNHCHDSVSFSKGAQRQGEVEVN